MFSACETVSPEIFNSSSAFIDCVNISIRSYREDIQENKSSFLTHSRLCPRSRDLEPLLHAQLQKP